MTELCTEYLFANFHLVKKEKMDRFFHLSLFMLVSHLFYACFGGE